MIESMLMIDGGVQVNGLCQEGADETKFRKPPN